MSWRPCFRNLSKDPHKNKLDPSDQKYKLKTRKNRTAANKAALLFDPDCDCCMRRMKRDESSVPKENHKTVLEKVFDPADSSKSQSQSPANHSVQSQPKSQNEPKIETPKFRKNKTPKKSRKNALEKSFEPPVISKCFHCDKESSKEIPLQRCSACNRNEFETQTLNFGNISRNYHISWYYFEHMKRINYCSRDCQRNDWAR